MSNQVFVLGDIHGSAHPIKEFMRRNSNLNFDGTDTIILLGDAGLNYFLNDKDYYLKKTLSKLPFKYFLIRGNHEERPSIVKRNNPSKWEYDYYFENLVFVEKEFPNIKYALDHPAEYTIKGLKTLVLPGAYSVDKMWRLATDRKWFPYEQMNEAEMQFARNICERLDYKCDLVLSHTCPSMFQPTDLFLEVIDQNTVDKSMEMFFGELEYKLSYKAWLFGHYHRLREYPRIDNKKVLMLYNNWAIDIEQYINEDEMALF